MSRNCLNPLSRIGISSLWWGPSEFNARTHTTLSAQVAVAAKRHLFHCHRPHRCRHRRRLHSVVFIFVVFIVVIVIVVVIVVIVVAIGVVIVTVIVTVVVMIILLVVLSLLGCSPYHIVASMRSSMPTKRCVLYVYIIRYI